MKRVVDSWTKTTIGEVYSFIGGGTPSKSNRSFWNGTIPWASIKDISQVKVLNETQDTITEEGLRNSAANIAEVDDVILGTRMLPGKAVIASIRTAINQDLKIVKPKIPILSKFTRYQFEYLKDEFLSRSGGTTVQGITIDKMNEIPFLLPSLPEQKRIVAKLDTLFGHLDELRSRLDKIPILLKQFRQAVLTQAVTGKLTEEWRRGKGDSSWEKKQLDSFSMPAHWRFIPLGDVCEKFTYGTSAKSHDAGKVAVIRMGNIQNGKIDWSDLKYTSDQVEISKYALVDGDVLFNRTNSPELVGKTCVYDGKIPAIYAGYLIKIWKTKQLNSYFLNLIFNSPYGRDWAWRSKSDGVSQSNINAKKLAAFEIPLPPVIEQSEIVRRTGPLFSLADKLDTAYQSLSSKVNALPAAILSHAFQGELLKDSIQTKLKAYGQEAEELLMAAEPKDTGGTVT